MLAGLAVRREACLRLAPFAWAAGAAYLVYAYSEIHLYASGMGVSPMQRHTRLAAALLATAATLTFAAAEHAK